MFTTDGMQRKKLFDSLLAKIEQLGREPSFQEAKEDQNMPDPNDYAFYFGSYSNAVKEAWGEYNFKKRVKKHSSIIIKKPIKH